MEEECSKRKMELCRACRERQSALPGHVVLSCPGPSLDFNRRTEEAVVAVCRVGGGEGSEARVIPSSLAWECRKNKKRVRAVRVQAGLGWGL